MTGYGVDPSHARDNPRDGFGSYANAANIFAAAGADDEYVPLDRCNTIYLQPRAEPAVYVSQEVMKKRSGNQNGLKVLG